MNGVPDKQREVWGQVAGRHKHLYAFPFAVLFDGDQFYCRGRERARGTECELKLVKVMFRAFNLRPHAIERGTPTGFRAV